MNIIAVVSKPIQYINARNAMESYCSKFSCKPHKRVLVILNHFSDSTVFFKRIKKFDHLWDLVIYSDSRIKAFLKLKDIKFDLVFSNSDISKDAILIKTFNLKCSLILYEEGWGNYIHNAIYDQNVIRKTIYSFLFLNKQYGSSVFTKLVYLHYPNKAPKNISSKVISFDCSFSSYLLSKADLLKKIFPLSDILSLKNMGKNKLAFLLPSKNWNYKFESLDLSEYDAVFVKPHPHTLDYNVDFAHSKKMILLDNNTFLELELSLLSRKKLVEIDVYHDNSMIGVYLLGTGVTINNIGESSKDKVLSDFFSLFSI